MKFAVRYMPSPPKFILFAFFLSIGAHLILSQTRPSEARRVFAGLYKQKEYFALRDALKRYKGANFPGMDFFRGAVANKFNRPAESVRLLESYLRSPHNKELEVAAYEMLADNYRKTFNYKFAAENFNVILSRLNDRLSAGDKVDYQNLYAIWSSLENVPRQTVSIRSASTIKSTTNAADLIDVPVAINGRKLDLVFDTGANISTISESYAKKLGLQLIESKVDIGSSTGVSSKAKLGIANQLRFGNAVFRNVVFLVFPDAALYVQPLSLQLNGYLGFPVISALREVRISQNGEIYVPAQPRPPSFENMCLEGLTPVVQGEYLGRKLTLLLDTGANRSDLYPPFFKEFETEIKGKYRVERTNRAGVGSTTVVSTYKAIDLVLKIGGRDAKFPQIAILPEFTTDDSRYFYGTMGQDLVKQFREMTLNFESMSITLN